MFIIRSNKRRFFVYFILFLSYLNTVLRPNAESSVTLFRLLLPLMIYYMFKYYKLELKYFFIFSFFLIPYYFIVSYFSHFGVSILTIGNAIHYTIILLLFFFIKGVSKEFGGSFYRHISLMFYLIIFLALIENYFNFNFPNTKDVNNVHGFFFGENDFSAGVAIAILILILIPSNKNIERLIKMIFIIIGIYFIFDNGSRLSLLAVLLFIIIYIFNRNKLFWGPIILLTGFIAGAFIFNILFENDALVEMLLNPIVRILTLNPFPINYGSVVERTNVIIYGIQELKHSYFFGIGPGNTLALLSKGEFLQENAKSMHNFLIQIIIEGGWAILIILSFLIKIIRIKLKLKLKINNLMYLSFVFFGILILSSLSIGAFSNYFFFTVYFYGILTLKNQKEISEGLLRDKEESLKT